MLTVVCVRTGTKYGPEYVSRLRRGVSRHLRAPHEFICLTDQPCGSAPLWYRDVTSYDLPGWWAKMLVFNRNVVGGGARLFIDLDMVVACDLTPLAFPVGAAPDFVMSRNFTRMRGNTAWPCDYSSAVMYMSAGWGQAVWDEFAANAGAYMAACRRGGDQLAIQKIVGQPAATWQDVLPAGALLHYKDLTDAPDPRARLVVFGGNTRPSAAPAWVIEEWTR